MYRFMTCLGVVLLSGMLASCGGGGGGGGDSPSPSTTNTATPPNNGGTPPPSNGGTPPAASKPGRFEETDTSVTLSPGHWTAAGAKFGLSGGPPVPIKGARATVSF